MKIHQKRFTHAAGWETIREDPGVGKDCQLVLAFGNRELLSASAVFGLIRAEYPKAAILLNSTAGEIHGASVSDKSILLTAVYFEKTAICTAKTHISEAITSFQAGRGLGQRLQHQGLKYVLLISDGQRINGSELVQGLQDSLPENTIITGGLAGDGADFEKTLVGLDEEPLEGRIAAIGFYGDALKVSYGSMGGWDPFGPERLITKSAGNVLYMLDDQPALDVYKMYLGEYAGELPGAGLLFPLCIRPRRPGPPLVRTILSVSPEEKSLTFAGDMPEGTFARLMKANFDRLIDGASQAVRNSIINNDEPPELALLISCVGRKLVLDQRVEEEIEAVRAALGPSTAITGFYSYGEICPSAGFLQCELHNQTMTITTFREEGIC